MMSGGGNLRCGTAVSVEDAGFKIVSAGPKRALELADLHAHCVLKRGAVGAAAVCTNGSYRLFFQSKVSDVLLYFQGPRPACSGVHVMVHVVAAANTCSGAGEINDGVGMS